MRISTCGTCDIGLGQSAIDYAAIGFYLYEMASLAAIVLSVSASYISKHEEPSTVGEIPTPAPKPVPKPVPPTPGPTPTNKVVCPKCKAVQEKDAAFCRFCGAPLNNSKPISPKPTPIPKPTPPPSPAPTPAPAHKGAVFYYRERCSTSGVSPRTIRY